MVTRGEEKKRYSQGWVDEKTCIGCNNSTRPPSLIRKPKSSHSFSLFDSLPHFEDCTTMSQTETTASQKHRQKRAAKKAPPKEPEPETIQQEEEEQTSAPPPPTSTEEEEPPMEIETPSAREEDEPPPPPPKKKSTPKAHPVRRSVRAGLVFPVGRTATLLRKKLGQEVERIGEGAPVYLAAVLEYLAAEVLELSGNAAAQYHKKRIAPQHIRMAIKHDEALSRLIGSDRVIMLGSGVEPTATRQIMYQKLTNKLRKQKRREHKRAPKLGS